MPQLNGMVSLGPYGINYVPQQRILEDHAFNIALYAVENPWLWRLLLHHDLKAIVSYMKTNGQEEYLLYFVEYCGMLCATGIGKLCNNVSDF